MANGKWFDQVYLLFSQPICEKDQERHFLYVGMSRAKSLLSIHYQEYYMDSITAEALDKIEIPTIAEGYGPLILQLGMKDIWAIVALDKSSFIA